MTGQEMERAIEFLLQSQAAHDVRLEQLTTQVAGLTTQVATLTTLATDTSRQLQAYAETQSEFIQITTRTMSGLADGMTKLAGTVRGLAHRVTGLEDKMSVMADTMTGLAGTVTGLADRVTGLDDKMSVLADKMAGLADAQARTERTVADTNARLDRLAGIVEQHLAGHS